MSHWYLQFLFVVCIIELAINLSIQYYCATVSSVMIPLFGTVDLRALLVGIQSHGYGRGCACRVNIFLVSSCCT